MKRHATLIQLPEFDWSEAKLSRDSRASVHIIARYETACRCPSRTVLAPQRSKSVDRVIVFDAARPASLSFNALWIEA